MKGPALTERDFHALSRFKKARSEHTRQVCEICAVEIQARHEHLIEPLARRIVCSCQSCALLFDGPSGRFLRIPRDVVGFGDLRIDMEWQSLAAPIGLAFFFFSKAADRVIAVYPSPAGATESALPINSWQEIASRHSRLQRMRPDVEALLANRLGDAREYYLAPIDRCYELTGLLRKHWSGFTGGDELWNQLRSFFGSLREQAITVETAYA